MAELREVYADVHPYIRTGVEQYIKDAIRQIEYLAGLADASEDPAGITTKLETEYQVELHVQDRIVIRQRLVKIMADKLSEHADLDNYAGIQDRSGKNAHLFFNMQFVWDNLVFETFEQMKELIEGGAMQGAWLSRQISGYANWIAKHINEGLENWVSEFVDEVMGEEWSDDPSDPMAELNRLDRDERSAVSRMVNDFVKGDLMPKVWRHFHLFASPEYEWGSVHGETFERRKGIIPEMLETFEPDARHPDAGKEKHRKPKRPKERAGRTF
jgi:hypothetical protein